jgi:hypothetical protein
LSVASVVVRLQFWHFFYNLTLYFFNLFFMPHDFTLTSGVLANGRTVYYGQLSGSQQGRFVIGYRTSYLDNFGLYNTSTQQGLVYRPADYEAQFGFWAWFLYPTAMAESKGSFFCLNTYDRARFTFTFMQYAAHVPNGDFVVFLRKLLQLPAAADYFPRLILQNNRVCYRSDNGVISALESDTSTEPLMNYLNPTLNDVERQELICSARMVHWAQHDAAHRKLQVETAVALLKEKLPEYHRRFGLHGAPARVCLMVADIRHQGRAKNDRIAAALNTNGNYDRAYRNLAQIGEVNYAGRIRTLKNTIASLLSQGRYQMRYDAQANDFVPA